MHIQIVQFNLEGMTAAEYAHACDLVFARPFTQIKGLMEKIWLSSPETNTFGGVYLWRDKQSMLNFQKTELFQSVLAHPHLSNVSSQDYGILEAPTRLTRGLAA